VAASLLRTTRPVSPLVRHLVFVFGTLQQGFPNFACNRGVRLPGDFQTCEARPLFLVGERCSPWLIDVPGHGHRVCGQVFEVDDNTLAAMDSLERVDAPDGYRRRTLAVERVPIAEPASDPLQVHTYLKDLDQLQGQQVHDGPLARYTLSHAARYRPRRVMAEAEANAQAKAQAAPPPMDPQALSGRLVFVQEAERLKQVLRSATTSGGRHESTAEHSWRLCLLAMTLQDLLGPLDFERVLKLCVVHDLGEALSGDVPATAQIDAALKSDQERRDLRRLTQSLPDGPRQALLALWEDYEVAGSPEARIVKALDKIETIIQHNQGANAPDFDYRFNLGYGRRYADVHPVVAALRARVDADTLQNAEADRPTPAAD
jgi:putative hydrolases of HD superfamily